MRIRHKTAHILLETLESRQLLSAAPACAQPVTTREVTVMSQNLYQGADLTPVISLLAIGDLAHVPAAVSQVWAAQQSTDFTLRAPAIADQIVAAHPDIIGLQEVSQWVFIPPTGPQDAQVTDFLQILTANLTQRGMHYTPVVITPTYTATLPDDKGDYIRLTDRNVILVNQDAKGLNVTSSSDGHFAAQFVVGGIFNENSSWQSIDATKGGRAFRFVNTHLTSVAPVINQLQAAELLAGPAATNLPLIMAGDFNSDAYHGTLGGPDVTGTYDLLAGAGLTDAWTTQPHPGDLGLTWGLNDTLTSPVPTFNQRIDFVWTRGTLHTRSMSVLGTTPLTLPNGLKWTSDHAGIVTTIQLTAKSSLHKHNHAKGHHFATV